MELEYFTCTLGEAAIHGRTDPSFTDINTLIRLQAERNPNRPAVGFYSPSSAVKEPWQSHVLSFAEIQRGTTVVAEILSRASKQGLSSSETVALLCSSTADFLFTWLGLLRLGHRVLLLAPQLAPSAIAHLCNQCGVHSLLYDEQYQDLARGTGKHMAAEEESEFWIFDIGTVMGDKGVFETIKHEPDRAPELPKVKSEDIAFYFHTSGTSTGLPKPIPQSHYGAIGVLPTLDGTTAATFTTTPLYHGGIADLFRAWSSNAMIWLFPGKSVPITAANIVRCLQLSQDAASSRKSPPVQFFSSVPYVLQMMEQDKQGLEQLQGMATVGVGGAALPDEVGRRLVERGVNVVSRFGSAECGFLLCSRRQYEHDQDWQYLRDYTQPPQSTRSATTCKSNVEASHTHTNGGDEENFQAVLRFEPRDGGLSELVVLPGWPHRAKTNRPDGSYATSDLFEPHKSISNAWRYHSRADAQLTLITGKKFDPAPLEAAIAASSTSVSDVLIFGDGKPYPGALVFRSKEAADESESHIAEEVWTAIRKLNRDGQAHTRIQRDMISIMSYDAKGLEKSSKGTIIRNKATERFAAEIDGAYDKMDGAGKDIPDEDVTRFVLDSVRLVRGDNSSTKVTEQTDLYASGFDSIASIQLRRRLGPLLPDGEALPFSIVEDCGSVHRLAEYILKLRHGEAVDRTDDGEQLMLNLVEKYSRFTPSAINDSIKSKGYSGDHASEVVVLTGTTGALGSHVLDLYCQKPNVSKIYCLVRGEDPHAARERVRKALSQRQLSDLVSASPSPGQKVEVLQCKLSEDKLGLSDQDYDRIAASATIFVHLAWAVNFRLKLHHFEREHIAGTRNLLNLALSAQQKHPNLVFLFCSSTASCTGLSPSDLVQVPEEIMSDPSSSSPLGYGRSKWVAEAIVARSTASQESPKSCLRRAAVLRVGQLSGDTSHGAWNESEAWPIMLRSVKDTKCLPALRHQCLDWLPVDIAAQAFVEAGDAMQRAPGDEVEGAKIFHVLNPHREPSWMDMLDWLREKEDFKTLEPKQWIERLEVIADKNPDHPVLKLLGLWKGAYGEAEVESSGHLSFDLHHTCETLPSLRGVQPLDRTYFERLWTWLETEAAAVK